MVFVGSFVFGIRLDEEMQDASVCDPDNSFRDPDNCSGLPGNTRNSVNIDSFIPEFDRYRISHAAAAALLPIKELFLLMVRKRNVEFAKAGGISCLGFDGKRDNKSKVIEVDKWGGC